MRFYLIDEWRVLRLVQHVPGSLWLTAETNFMVRRSIISILDIVRFGNISCDPIALHLVSISVFFAALNSNSSAT